MVLQNVVFKLKQCGDSLHNNYNSENLFVQFVLSRVGGCPCRRAAGGGTKTESHPRSLAWWWALPRAGGNNQVSCTHRTSTSSRDRVPKALAHPPRLTVAIFRVWPSRGASPAPCLTNAHVLTYLSFSFWQESP